MKISIKFVLIIAIVLIVLCFAIFIIKNSPNSIRFGIFGSLGDMDALEKYAVTDATIPKDGNLKKLVPVEKWENKVNVDGAECIVRAYVFGSHDEAVEYYKRAAHRTSANDGANGSASAGGLGKASYVTMNDMNVLYVTGRNLKDIGKVLDKFFEEVSSALLPFAKD